MASIRSPPLYQLALANIQEVAMKSLPMVPRPYARPQLNAREVTPQRDLILRERAEKVHRENHWRAQDEKWLRKIFSSAERDALVSMFGGR